MGITIKATCGDKSKSIEYRRPSWESMRKAYDTINTADPKCEELQKIFKQAIISKGRWYGCSQEEIEQATKEAMEQIIGDNDDDDNYDRVWQRYTLVGGQPLSEYISYKNFFHKSPNYADYSNTCALRVSYALNYSTHPIKTMDRQIAGRGYQGGDGHIYYLGVFDIIDLLKLNWKKPTTYTEAKKNIKYGRSEDFYHQMTSKDKNRQFFKELQSIKRKGIVAMNSASGLRHVTLWNGNNFVDVDFGYYNFLEEANYVIIKELYFWDLI